MKIDRVSNVATRGTRTGARDRSGKSDSFLNQLGGAESSSPSAVSGSAPVGGVDALLALQEIGDQPDSQGQAKQRGEDLLDRLDEIRLSLLEGRMTPATIQRLAEMAATKRSQVRDPQLAEILDEIELRAAVELAKLGR